MQPDVQFYGQYLSDYQPNSYSKLDAHDYHQLKKTYSDIQWKNRFAPVLLSHPKNTDINTAISLKEQACEFRHTLSSLQVDDTDNMFVQQTTFSSNPSIISVRSREKNTEATDCAFQVTIQSFASPQKNIGKYLSSDTEFLLPEGSYSFELYIKKKHYELQFGVSPKATNRQIQDKIKNLINKSNLGVKANVLQDTDSPNLSALELVSDATGTPLHSPLHYEITDDPAKSETGIITYFGLNGTILAPTNAECSVNGQTVSSYCNTLSVGPFEIILHPENQTPSSFSEPISIGLRPNVESIKLNVEAFMQGYNQFIESSRTLFQGTEKLQGSIHKLTNQYETELQNCGIRISDALLLQYNSSDSDTDTPFSNIEVINGLQNFGNAILKKVNDVTLDPMEYVNKSICFYRDPSTPFINPYMTSIYSGMLFETYV